MRFVDLHCHVLPGVDDGASSLLDAVEMLALAERSGTEKIVATPHMFAPGIGCDDVDVVRASFERFRAALAERAASEDEEIGDISVELGAENYVSAELVAALERERVLPLAGSRALLLEFWPLTTATAARHAVDKVQAAGLVPVLAHVERYRFLHEEPSGLEELVAAGCVAQVNAAAILGEQGLRVAQVVDRWLRRGLVALVASDGHGVGRRSPELGSVFEHLRARYGEDTAALCLRENPLALLSDLPLTRPPETRRFRWWPLRR